MRCGAVCIQLMYALCMVYTYKSQKSILIHYEVQKNYLRPINMKTTCGAQINMHNRQK